MASLFMASAITASSNITDRRIIRRNRRPIIGSGKAVHAVLSSRIVLPPAKME
jgi:hypothetical protein